MANGTKKLKAALNKAIDFIKSIPTKLAKLATPVGQVIGWLLLIILIVILFTVIGQAATRAIARLIGINWNYKTYNDDLEVIKQLNASGYESAIDSENFQNFKSFEYAVLMDAAEYIRNTKQEMFDIGFNEGEYEFERDILRKNKAEEYNTKIAELSQQYANVGGGDGETSAKLMNVAYSTDQRNVSDDTLQKLIKQSKNERNITVPGIDESGSIKGGTNRVTGPFLIYEFKSEASGDAVDKSYTTQSTSSTDQSAPSTDPKKESSTENLKAKYDKIIFIGDDRTVQMYSTKNGWNGASNEVDQLDTTNNYWEAKNNVGIRWLESADVANIEAYIEDKTAIVCLLGLNDVLTGQASQAATVLNKKAAEWNGKKKDVATFFVSVNPIQETEGKEITNEMIQKWNNEMKSGLSSDVTYIDSYSKIANTVQFKNWRQYQEKTYNDIYNIIVNTVNNYPENTHDADTYSLDENGKGSLEPYIYLTKEDIDFTYYFNKNDKVIEYPLLLNAYNGQLHLGSENSAEINRALLGISPVVFPDVDPSKYTQTPYYSNEAQNTVYKIPLRVLLGRYMPKAELLNAWSYVKQSVERDTENTEEKGIMDYTIEAIKGIYNEACLLGETTKTIEAKRESGDRTRSKDDTIYYSDEQTHKKSFVTFEKAGIESTKYAIDGLQDTSEEKIKLVTDFISAVIVQDAFTVTYEVTSPTGEATTEVDPVTGEETTQYATVTEERQVTVSLANLKLSERIVHGNYILASGSPEEGYTPPSSVEGINGYYVPRTNDVAGVLQEIKVATEEYLITLLEEGETYNGMTQFPEEIAYYNPVFLANRTEKVTQTLKIEHIRMPIFLVKSASTWCREIEYHHAIIQNQFKQNNRKYIVPKSVSSIGLTSFNTTANESYRGRAYSEVFSKIQEKDVINMLMVLEMSANEGSNDSYEYMRDLYKLVRASQNYAAKHGHTQQGDSRFIHEDTYKYVYIPDSILYFDDSQSQKIYWVELLTATKDDPITKDELNTIRTKDRDITWQLVEYDKYEECNTSGSTKVYALSPFGSPLVRTYYETMYQKGQDVKGNFSSGRHSGADWTGREKISDILGKGNSALSADNIGGAIYNYEYTHLAKASNQDVAKTKLEEILNEQKSNMPIVAIAPGKVENVAYSARSGFYVRILHSKEEGIVSYYMHLKRWPLVNVGDYVGAGTLLGYEGNTGRSFGTHLHFQLEKAGSVVSPQDYIFPTFNPFYYEEMAEKTAKDGKYDLKNDYLSLQRTVMMIGNDSNSVAKVQNQVPATALVQDYETLIQNQASMENRNLKMSGEKDWGTGQNSFESVEEYDKYLSDNGYHDLFLREAFFDKQMAMAEGYLQAPSNMLTGDIIVKIDIPGALPALTKNDLKTILNGWLNARYKNKQKVNWLMSHVFTDKNIDIMLAGEQKYKVSAVFAMAVATIEQNMGLSGTRLASEPACNIFSIKGVDQKYGSGPGYILYQGGKKWRRYGSYGNAFDDFADLIGGRGTYYFNKGNYTIGTIGPIYCPGGTWEKSVTKMVIEIMKYYPGEWSPPTEDGAAFGNGSKEVTGIAKNCMEFYKKNKFEYSQDGGAGRLVPPYDANGNCRQKKYNGYYRTDCSTYVSWVIYEFAKAHGYKDLQKEFSRQHSSYDFQSIGQKLKSGKKSGFYKYFELVQYGIPGNNFGKISNKIKAGDILVYREKGHHVEIAAGEGKKVYSWGSKPSSTGPASSYSRRSDATCVIRLKTI